MLMIYRENVIKRKTVKEDMVMTSIAGGSCGPISPGARYTDSVICSASDRDGLSGDV